MRIGGRKPIIEPDAALIRMLAELLAETGLSEIEYTIGDQRIRVARHAAVAAAPAVVSVAAPQMPDAAPVAPTAPAEPVSLASHPGAVKAPMVGVAYLATTPGADPFVRVGDSIAEGDTLMIIEAMKVMNQIRAPRAGRIARILVADTDPVEYGSVLMLFE